MTEPFDKLVAEALLTLDKARTWRGPRNLPKPSARKLRRQRAKAARKANRAR